MKTELKYYVLIDGELGIATPNKGEALQTISSALADLQSVQVIKGRILEIQTTTKVTVSK